MKNTTFHTIVIGAGSGGLTVALGLASAGKNVLLIEKGHMGGDCTNYGCVPSKALIHAEGDIVRSLETARSIRHDFQQEETQENFEKKYPNLKIVLGSATFIDRTTVMVDETRYNAKSIVIATGSDPRITHIDGVPPHKILTNRTIFDVEDITELVIVGGGFIAIEMALAFARRGVVVSMLIRSDRLGSGVDDDFTLAMKSLLEQAGVTIFYNTSIETGDEQQLIIKNTETRGSDEIKTSNNQTIHYSHILLALGRTPNIGELGLENAGVISDEKGITTDKYGRTNIKNIYAIGDVVSMNRQFTHLANHEGRGVIQSLLFPFWKKKIKGVNIPSVLYDRDLEFARTGMTLAEAESEYGTDGIITETIQFSHNDRARTESDTLGYVRIVAKRLSLQILGAEIVGRGAGEMISTLTLALDERISLYRLKNMIIPYPTRSDLIKRLADKMVIMTLTGLKSHLSWYIKKRLPFLGGIILWGSILGLFFSWKNSTGLDNQMLIRELYNLITMTAIGPIIYIVFYAFRPLVFFPATLLTFLSGLLFGVWGGFIYTMIGENLSASVAYFTGRFFGTHIPELRKSPISLDSEKTFSSILFTRLAFFPFDLVNYLSGFLRLPWMPFALATIIGIIPGALVFIIAGASIGGIENFSLQGIHLDIETLAISAVLFVASILLARFLKKKKK